MGGAVWVGTQGVCDECMGREGVLFLDHSFCGLVRFFIARNVGVCAYLVQGSGVAFPVSGLDEGDDGIKE